MRALPGTAAALWEWSECVGRWRSPRTTELDLLPLDHQVNRLNAANLERGLLIVVRQISGWTRAGLSVDSIFGYR